METNGMKQKRRTKYTYGQFASVRGKRYRVRKNITKYNLPFVKYGFACRTKCALYKDRKCNGCVSLIPLDAYFEKV